MSLAGCISLVFARFGATDSPEAQKNVALAPYPLTYPSPAGLLQCLLLHSPDSSDNCGFSKVPLIINSNMKSKHITSHSTNSVIVQLTQV